MTVFLRAHFSRHRHDRKNFALEIRKDSMQFFNSSVMTIAIAVMCFSGAAYAGSNSVSGSIDPDCTVEKAAKGAAMKTTVGVGNRCDAAETARDTTGVDGKADDAKNATTSKPGKKKKK
jgi:hypothetical protein